MTDETWWRGHGEQSGAGRGELRHAFRARRPEPVFHGCECPPGEFVVIMPAETDGAMHEFAGAGPTEADAEADAERHAIEALGADCARYPARPA